YGLSPAGLARLAVEADHLPDEVFLVAGLALVLRVAAVAGEEDGVADRDRAGGAHAGQLDLPEEVLGLGPLDGQAGFIAPSQAARPAELSPVSREGGRRYEEHYSAGQQTIHGGFLVRRFEIGG